MRRTWPLLALLAACPGSEGSSGTATFELGGTLRGTHTLDDSKGGRVTCSVDRDPGDPIDPKPVFTLALLAASDGSRDVGLYLSVRNFTGGGAYAIGATGNKGSAQVFERALLDDCGRPGDSSCYSTLTGCQIEVDSWLLGEPSASGVRTGTAKGRLSCERLGNLASDTVTSIRSGTFTCRATDWTAARD
jgi:hypothetical protein